MVSLLVASGDFMVNEEGTLAQKRILEVEKSQYFCHNQRMIIIAHDIRSLHNVGSIFRNCAAFGIEKLYLTGFTAVPPRKEISKVALGADTLIEWEQADIEKIILELKKDGYKVLGLETGEGSKLISSVQQCNIALVFGNEVEGIDVKTRAMLDGLVEIPMDKKRSLNVSVASGVAMYALNMKPKA